MLANIFSRISPRKVILQGRFHHVDDHLRALPRSLNELELNLRPLRSPHASDILRELQAWICRSQLAQLPNLEALRVSILITEYMDNSDASEYDTEPMPGEWAPAMPTYVKRHCATNGIKVTWGKAQQHGYRVDLEPDLDSSMTDEEAGSYETEYLY